MQMHKYTASTPASSFVEVRKAAGLNGRPGAAVRWHESLLARGYVGALSV